MILVKVKVRSASPSLTSPSSWHCGPLTHGPTVNLVLSALCSSAVSLVTGFWLPACPFNEVLAPHTAFGGRPLGPAPSTPQGWGLSLRSKASTLLKPHAHPCLSFFQTLFCGDRTTTVLGKYLQELDDGTRKLEVLLNRWAWLWVLGFALRAPKISIMMGVDRHNKIRAT